MGKLYPVEQVVPSQLAMQHAEMLWRSEGVGEHMDQHWAQAFASFEAALTRIEATPAVDREAVRTILWNHLGGDDRYIAINTALDAIMALPPVKQSDGLAERVKEACAKVADAHCVGLRGIGPVGRAQVNEARRIASAIRSLDITRMDSDEQV